MVRMARAATGRPDNSQIHRGCPAAALPSRPTRDSPGSKDDAGDWSGLCPRKNFKHPGQVSLTELSATPGPPRRYGARLSHGASHGAYGLECVRNSDSERRSLASRQSLVPSYRELLRRDSTPKSSSLKKHDPVTSSSHVPVSASESPCPLVRLQSRETRVRTLP